MVAAKILVVDGNVETRQFAKDTLVILGHQVGVAETGEEGLKRSAENLFDMVICEVDLPKMGGIELIQRIRALDPTVVPIVTTSRCDQETAVRALEAGARSFLTKPFSETELKLRVEKALRERKRMVDTRLLLGDLLRDRSDLQYKIAERERYLNYLIDAAPTGIISTDRAGKILTFNGKAERMYGYRQEEILGQHVAMLFGQDAEAIGPDDTGGLPEPNAYHIRKNDERFPVLVYRRDILDDKRQCIARLHVVEDRSEREQMEEQLLYAERLSLLGQLAPRIAHEFKTPLQIVSGSAELSLALLKGGQAKESYPWLKRILPAVSQMETLINQMLDLGKPVESKQQELDLREELERSLDTLKSLGVVRDCKIVKDFAPSLPKILGDPAQIEQVFRNLIMNAAQAMELTPERVLTLSLRAAPGGNRIEVAVADTGAGIPGEGMDRIYQPFFTTKPQGKGTGLGLPIVKTILDRHRASIAVESEVGVGTRFTVAFPAFQRPGSQCDATAHDKIP